MNSKRNTIINISLILITCIVIIVCIILGFSRQKNNNTEPETYSDSETASLNEELPSETFAETIAIPEPSTPENKTFSTDEDTYNYAVNMINERKYYSAIKYLRLIPNYKDAQKLMTKAYRQIQGEFFTYSGNWLRVIACSEMNTTTIASENVLNRSDWNLANGSIIQCRSDGFIDESGTFHLVTPWGSQDFYKPFYEPILNYNKSVKFKYLLGGYAVMEDSFILTADNRIIHYGYNSDTKKGTFSDCNIDALGENEKIVYISSNEVLTDLGYVYALTDNGTTWKLTKSDQLNNIVSINCGLYLYENGTVSYSNEDTFPIIASWSDIISIKSDISSIHSFLSYCCGLTSDGSILVALEGSRTNMKPFPADRTYVSVTCVGNIIAALTDTGDVYTYDMEKHLRRYPSTENSTETETPVTIPDAGSDLMFSSDEAIYNFAVSQLNTRKYYTALKYLQKIPNYKDSAKLQYDAYRHIHQDYFAYIYALQYDNTFPKITACEGMNADTLASTDVISLTDIVNFKGTVDHYFDYGFVDTEGNIHLTQKINYQDLKNKMDALIEYNKKVKFKQFGDSVFNILLTMDNKVICQGDDSDSDPFTNHKDFIEFNTDSLASSEKIVFLSGSYAMSNCGNVYWCNTFNHKLEKQDSLKNVISVDSDGSCNLHLTNTGAVICSSSTAYTAVNNWTDIISIEINDYGCIGLKSDGTIVTASKDGSNKDYLFPPDVKFTTIVGFNGTAVAALSDTGKLYIFTL